MDPLNTEKQKRRQNVACDPCKLRRVKCDLLTLLTATSTTTPAPLNVLVQQNPDVVCTNCASKGVTCVKEGILNPPKGVRGGKRIEEAKRIFGAGNGEDAEIAREEGQDNGDITIEDLLGIGAGPSQPLATPNGNGISSINGPPVQARIGNPHFASGPISGQALPHLAGQTDSHPSQTASSTPYPLFQATFSSSVDSSHRVDGTGWEDDQEQRALSIWQHLSANTPAIIAKHLSTSALSSVSTPASASASGSSSSSPDKPDDASVVSPDNAYLHHHTLHGDAPLPVLGRLDIETDQYVSPAVDTRPGASASTSSNYGSTPGGGGSRNHPVNSGYRNGTPYHSFSQPAASSLGSKRRLPMHGDHDWSLELQNGGSSGDPWHVWVDPAASSSSWHWGRREALQQTMADRAIGNELSRHLITVYFHAVHFSLPVISPESFYHDWELSGRRNEFLSEPQQVLCAVLEAWAARYSDHPVLFNLPPEHSSLVPKVITKDGQFLPGSSDRTHWGKARLAVCNALLERAGRMIDESGIMRKPSVTGLQALSLFNQLSHMGDQGNRPETQLLQNMLMHTAVIEQLRMLNLFFTSNDPVPLSDDESPTTTHQMRMKQRRLFWATAVSDACWSAATGQAPRVPLEELQAGRAWIDEVLSNLPDSTFKVLAFFMKIWHRLTMLGREVSIKVTSYDNRKGTVNVEELCATVRELWSGVKSTLQELNGPMVKLLRSCDLGADGFSPINYISNMRLTAPFLLLILHEVIRKHIAFRQSLHPTAMADSYIVAQDEETNQKARHKKDLELLLNLERQSIDVLLFTCRAQIPMIRAMLPTGLFQVASILTRVLIAMSQFLAEVPTNEQGYPDTTLGGSEWTWSVKQKEVLVCIEALYQMGWAWSDTLGVVHAVQRTMERMKPKTIANHQFGQYHNSNPKTGVALLRQKALAAEEETTQVALGFWPPKPIPEIMAGLMLTQDTIFSLPIEFASARSTRSSSVSFDLTSGGALASSNSSFTPSNQSQSQFDPNYPTASTFGAPINNTFLASADIDAAFDLAFESGDARIRKRARGETATSGVYMDNTPPNRGDNLLPNTNAHSVNVDDEFWQSILGSGVAAHDPLNLFGDIESGRELPAPGQTEVPAVDFEAFMRQLGADISPHNQHI